MELDRRSLLNSILAAFALKGTKKAEASPFDGIGVSSLRTEEQIKPKDSWKIGPSWKERLYPESDELPCGMNQHEWCLLLYMAETDASLSYLMCYGFVNADCDSKDPLIQFLLVGARNVPRGTMGVLFKNGALELASEELQEKFFKGYTYQVSRRWKEHVVKYGHSGGWITLSGERKFPVYPPE